MKTGPVRRCFQLEWTTRRGFHPERDRAVPSIWAPFARSEEALKLLGSWAATIDSAESAHSAHQS